MCKKCGGKGHYGVMVWSGAYMFKPCDCGIAKQKEEQALKRLRKLHLEMQERIKGISA